MKTFTLWLSLAAIALVTGCNRSGTPAANGTASPGATAPSTIFLSVTSDANNDPQSVDMAMKFAGFSLDEGRQVVMFFNVKGVAIPTASLPEDHAFQENEPIKTQLAALIERGADIHVCPICMKALGVEEGDLMEGAKVTTRPSLFKNIHGGTTVFTY